MQIIEKSGKEANLENYDLTCATFDWHNCKGEIDYFADNKINAAFNAMDRHLHKGRANKIALYAVDEAGHLEKFTFQEIASASNQLAHALRSLRCKQRRSCICISATHSRALYKHIGYR